MIAVLGVPLVCAGALAYAGVWRGWSQAGRHYWGLGIGWWGLGLCLLGLAGVLPPGAAGVAGIAGIVLALFGGLGLFWLPAPVTPRWFRDAKRQRRARIRA